MAQEETHLLPVYHCPRIGVPLEIDGTVDDEAWQAAQAEPLCITETGEPAERSTAFSACYDDGNLYVLFQCEDPEPWATIGDHDGDLFEEDVVEVFLHPEGDQSLYFELEVSPLNVTFDAAFDSAAGLTVGNRRARDWTCEGMKTGVSIERSDEGETLGWTAEISIPFSALGRSAPKAGEQWRVNFYRIDYRPGPPEFQAWSPTLIRNFHTLSRFGTIIFE